MLCSTLPSPSLSALKAQSGELAPVSVAALEDLPRVGVQGVLEGSARPLGKRRESWIEAGRSQGKADKTRGHREKRSPTASDKGVPQPLNSIWGLESRIRGERGRRWRLCESWGNGSGVQSARIQVGHGG